MLPPLLCLLWSTVTAVWADLTVPPNEVNTTETPPDDVFPWSHPRLPASVKPEHYFLSIHPDLSSDSFTGQVHILVTALNDTNFIVLNSKGLVVLEATLQDLTLPPYKQAPPVVRGQMLLHRVSRAQEASERNQMVLLRVLESQATEQLALISNNMSLVAGHKYQLTLSYSGTFSNDYSGIYKASYQTPADAATRTIVVTHFEPSSARKAFPCFDEPDMKAVFSLAVVRQSEHVSLSNMPKLYTKESKDEGVEEDYYQTSVRMSSYLLAFVVCDDNSSNWAKTKRGVKVSVFAASHLMNQTQHALQAAVETLDFYEELFQIPYALPKLDLVAVPDLEGGAMENWGLVTFRETSLLHQEQRDSMQGKFWVSLVTAHELAHQWFGNLVTMQWWEDLWLNEGFASYLQYLALRHLKPDWCVGDQHLLTNTFRALNSDSTLTSHPVSFPVSGSTQIRQMFDMVSYSKGASIIGMLHSYLSDPVFLGGIRQYLSEHRFNNAVPDDLWRAMSESAQRSGESVDVKALMDTWITQQGYPVVTVAVQGTQLHLRQNLFTILPQNDTGAVWQIPFTFRTSRSSAVTGYLMKSKEEVIELPTEVAWIKANVNSSGFYRVSYDRRTLRGLLTQLRGGRPGLSPTDRAGLIDDTFHLARQGSVKYYDAFALSTFMKTEEEYLPITVFISHMMNMIVKFSFSGDLCIIHLLKGHLWAMLGRLAQAQRWEDTGALPVQRRRAKLLELAAQAGRSPATEQEALRLYHFWMAKDGQHPLPSSLRGLIYKVGVMKGGQAEWTFLLQRYRCCSSSQEKALMLAALCHTNHHRKRLWLLSASLQNHIVKTQDFGVVVEKLARQPRNTKMVWEFLQKHWDELVVKFPLGSSSLSGIVIATTSHFNSTQKYDEVYDFFVTQRRLGHLRFVQTSLETIQTNMQWLKSNTAAIQSWLQKTYRSTFKAYPFCKREFTYRFNWGTTIRISV